MTPLLLRGSLCSNHPPLALSPMAKGGMRSELGKQMPEPSVVLRSSSTCSVRWGVSCFALGNPWDPCCKGAGDPRLREALTHAPSPALPPWWSTFLSTHSLDWSMAPAAHADESMLCSKHSGMFSLSFLFGVFLLFLLQALSLPSSGCLSRTSPLFLGS